MTDRCIGMREWRQRQGLKLQEVADLIGRTESYLSRVERGHRTPSALDQVHIARALNVRVRDLFPVVKRQETRRRKAKG